MKKLIDAAVRIGLLALLSAPCAAQIPAESLAVWASELRNGTLPRRMEIVGVLAEADSAPLPIGIRDALIAELNRINAALFDDKAIEGEQGVGGEGLGEYYIHLTAVVWRLRTPEADRALIPAVGVSGGIQRRVARLGDVAIPTLARMVERSYESGPALETMGLAWFWADSTGAALSDESRETILRQFLAASGNTDLWLGLSAALNDARDPAFLPLARALERGAVEQRKIAGADLQLRTIPTLEAALERLTPQAAVGNTTRVTDAICADAVSGARRGACESLRNELDAAVRHVEAGRLEAARNVLEAVARRADTALASGAITAEEHALIGGGVRQVVARL